MTILEILIGIFIVSIAPFPWWLIIFHYFVRKQTRTITIISYVSIFAFWIFFGVVAYHFREVILAPQYSPTWVTRILGAIFLSIAIYIDIQVVRTLGFRRLYMLEEIQQVSSLDTFIASGVYKMARHPRYVEYMLISLAGGFLFGYICLFYNFIYLVLTFSLATIAEEKELVDRFGQSYIDYQKRVPKFFIRF